MLRSSFQGKSGATTVASTMILARAAGIPVFVTGGIGGVHRGASECKDFWMNSTLFVNFSYL